MLRVSVGLGPWGVGPGQVLELLPPREIHGGEPGDIEGPGLPPAKRARRKMGQMGLKKMQRGELWHTQRRHRKISYFCGP